MDQIGTLLVQNSSEALGGESVAFAVKVAQVANLLRHGEAANPQSLVLIAVVCVSGRGDCHMRALPLLLAGEAFHVDLCTADRVGVKTEGDVDNLHRHQLRAKT